MRRLQTTAASAPVVLLLQPHDDGLEMYTEFLRYHELEVIGVSDPRDAQNVAPKADVIVTGILLAGSMDGIEFIARLRRDDRTSHTPIIVLTACAWTTERERAEQAGCDLFLTKPCLPGELLYYVRRAFAAVRLRPARATLRPARAIGVSTLPALRQDVGIAADSTRVRRRI